MRVSLSTVAFSIVLAGVLLTQNASAAAPLRVGGTGAAIGMIENVGHAFTGTGGAELIVIPGLGSTGAINALADHNLDIAVSARPLKPAERAVGLQQIVVLRTAFVLATSHRHPNGLKTADLPALFAADRPRWDDGSPIRIILRPRSETDTALLGNMFAGMDKAIESMRRRAEVPVTATDQDNADLAERLQGSLTGTTLAQLKTERRRLSAISLDGVEPTLANLESGKYRFAKYLFFIVRADGPADGEKFAGYLRSPQGQEALRNSECLLGGE